jgi:phosphoribosyl 1,2-cyclic phosphodiesterase
VQSKQDTRMTVRFWGVRGSIPSPGPETYRYGGNTACVEVRAGGELLILDAGSGIRQLGLALNQAGAPIVGTILISHAHWDHIHGLPFFAPAMAAGNRFKVYGCTGTSPHLRHILAGQMETPYFPVSLNDMPGTLEFDDLPEGLLRVGPLTIRTIRLHHPGMTLAYRIELGPHSLVYATDNEPTPAVNGGEPSLDCELIRFAAGADLLICDAQYTREEYRQHIGWGHSSVTDAVRLALAAGVRKMALFHHDPERTDAALDELLTEARAELLQRKGALECLLAAEGLELVL